MGGISSIGGAAALLASRIFADLADRRIIVFGAGEMAASTVRHLRSKNLGELWVANRSLEHAEALARELGGTAMGFDEGFRRLPLAHRGARRAGGRPRPAPVLPLQGGGPVRSKSQQLVRFFRVPAQTERVSKNRRCRAGGGTSAATA